MCSSKRGLILLMVLLLLPVLPGRAASFVLENEGCQLSLSPRSLAVTATHKATGHAWTHGASEGLNKNWQAFSNSGLVIQVAVNDTSVKQFVFDGEAEVRRLEDVLHATASFEEAGITLALEYSLLDSGFRVRVPRESIQEDKPSHKLHSLTLFPFLGATFGQQAGFVLVPDGSGALIDLSVPTQARQPYRQPVYGDDPGFLGLTAQQRYTGLKKPMPVSLPAFGLSLEGRGLMYHITSGAEYASIQAYAAGITTGYNWTSASFTYRDFYNVYSSSVPDLARTVRLNQGDKNDVDVQLDVHLLAGADAAYDGMARRLQEQLLARGELIRRQGPAHTLFASVLMADNYKTMLGRRRVEVTSQEQLKDMAAALMALAGPIRLEADGFMPGGKSHQPPGLHGIQGAFWGSLSEQMSDGGSLLSLYLDPVSTYQNAGGVSRRDLALNSASHPVTLRDERNITGGAQAGYWQLLHPEASFSLLKESASQLQAAGLTGLSLDGLGRHLFSSYGARSISRRDTALMHQEMLQGLSGLDVALRAPNSSLWRYGTAMLDMPLSGSGFVITTHSVPFVQLVLAGCGQVFAPYANFQPDQRDYLLTLLSYGMKPSYLLTHENPSLLARTDSRYIYSSQFSVWQDTIAAHLEYLRPAFDAIEDTPLTGHRMLAPGVFEASYANGIRLAVNLNQAPYDGQGLSLPAKDYVIIRKEAQ